MRRKGKGGAASARVLAVLSRTPVSTKQIRDALLEHLGPDPRQANANLWSILRKMRRRGEVEMEHGYDAITTRDGTNYRRIVAFWSIPVADRRKGGEV